MDTGGAGQRVRRGRHAAAQRLHHTAGGLAAAGGDAMDGAEERMLEFVICGSPICSNYSYMLPRRPMFAANAAINAGGSTDTTGQQGSYRALGSLVQ